MSNIDLAHSPLGQKSAYICEYDKHLLYPLPRAPKRAEIGIEGEPPFYGYDLWTAFEVSWLNLKGKPCVAVVDFIIPSSSRHFIESKSFKLYLNSFNQTRLASLDVLKALLLSDLSEAVGAPVEVLVQDESKACKDGIDALVGVCIDDLDIACSIYHPRPALLKIERPESVKESLVSHLLKSNCLVTGQPDWATLQITYEGPKIDREALLAYIVSYRNHNEFHEQCVERIFMDLHQHLQPTSLTVYARYTRRGGLDINPIRSTHPIEAPHNRRLFRQ